MENTPVPVQLSFRMASGTVSPILGLFGLPSPSYSRLQERGTLPMQAMMGGHARTFEREYGEGIFAVHVCGNVSGRIRSLGNRRATKARE